MNSHIWIFLIINFFTLSNMRAEFICRDRNSKHLNENAKAEVIFLGVSPYFSLSSDQENFYKMINIILEDEEIKKLVLLGSSYNKMTFNSTNLPQEYNEKVTFIETPDSFSWAQDIIEFTYDPVLKRNFYSLVPQYKLPSSEDQATSPKNALVDYNSYLSAQKNLSELLEQGELGIMVGQEKFDLSITHENIPAKSGQYGGNIESTNEGHCLIGDSDLTDSEWETLASKLCKSRNHVIKLPTHWLTAKHVDELIKPFPPSKHKKCHADFAIPSMKKAIELISKNPKDVFFDFQSKNLNQLSKSLFFRGVCAIYLQKYFPDTGGIVRYPQIKTDNYQTVIPKQNYIELLLELWGDSMKEQIKICLNLKNKDIYEILQNDERFKQSLSYSQSMLNLAKKNIQDVYAITRPDCKISFVELPTLFRVSQAYFKINNTDPVLVTSSETLMPNPINSLQVNNNIFIPEPHVRGFRDYMRSIYESYGLRPHFITALALFEDKGNLHCSSQSIRTCN